MMFPVTCIIIFSFLGFPSYMIINFCTQQLRLDYHNFCKIHIIFSAIFTRKVNIKFSFLTYRSRVSVSSKVIRYEPGSEEVSYSVNRKLRYDENLSYIIIGKYFSSANCMYVEYTYLLH